MSHETPLVWLRGATVVSSRRVYCVYGSAELRATLRGLVAGGRADPGLIVVTVVGGGVDGIADGLLRLILAYAGCSVLEVTEDVLVSSMSEPAVASF